MISLARRPVAQQGSQLNRQAFARKSYSLYRGLEGETPGALLLKRTEGAIELIDRLAECFVDHRDPGSIEHSARWWRSGSLGSRSGTRT